MEVCLGRLVPSAGRVRRAAAWAERDAAMLGTAESCSSSSVPQGAGAGATLGVVTELWPWAEQAWGVWDGGLGGEGPGTRLLRC